VILSSADVPSIVATDAFLPWLWTAQPTPRDTDAAG
jgi:hypothetical protein